MYHIERGPLLRDEEYAFSDREAVRNDVGNGL